MHKYINIRGVYRVFVLFFGACLAIFISLNAGADTSLTWLSSEAPTLIKNYSQPLADPLPSTVSSLGNRDCTNDTVTIRPSRALQTQQTATGCFADTSFGKVESSWLMQFSGASLAGKFVNYPGYASSIIAIPSSSNVIHTTSAAPNGVYLHLTKSIPSPVTIEKAITGEVTYRFTTPPSISLRDTNGQLMAAQTDSLSFSSNGNWAVVDLPNRAMVRINTDTFEALPFMNPFIYNGDSPAAQTAVSNDGRYVIVSSKSFAVFRIFDLATCTNIPTTITRSASCESRDLLPFIKSKFEGYISSTNLRFKSNTIVELFAASNNGSGVTRTNSTLLAPGQTQTSVSYLGMGDSFSSGEGDMKGGTYYEPGTDITENKCHLSQRSYPYLIRNAMAIETFHSVACSGARQRDLLATKQYEDSPNSNTLGEWTPGTDLQIMYLMLAKPDFITISIGGNDVGFADIITECVTSKIKVPLPTTCIYASDISERGNVAKRIADQFKPLKKLYEDLAKATNKKTKIYIVGYPQFVKESGGSCGANVHLDDNERYFVGQSTHYMNQVIKAAADAAGVYYLDIEDALQDKNLCSVVPDSQMGVNGLTEGDDQTAPWWMAYTPGNALGILPLSRLGVANESYHPNSNGHIYMKDKILGLTHGDLGSFAVCPIATQTICPRGDGKVPVPSSTYFGSGAASYASSINAVAVASVSEPPRRTDLLDESVLSGTSMTLKLDYLLPGSTVTFLSHTTGTQLGTITVGSSGSIQKLLATASLAPGVHTVYAQATDFAGESQIYYQTIFVPGPEGDINGNGTPDSLEVCGFSQPGGTDIDSDGRDDACDADYIPTPPTLTLTIENMLSVPTIPLH